MTLADWAKLNEVANASQLNSIAEMLTQENEILKDMGYLGVVESYPWHRRLRNWLGRKLARLAFSIAPDVRDDYY